ncbi:MAG TPA: hypothetical protein DDW94_05755 [Deltaproteobacteria bacterium]|nr:MAG: hypothetical protein A2Z79_04195 [Deltaproteobacteria bacterium GWA2_55_82]OGQ64127.1 MAG: hypothetical protein A3I81_10575 [Deltaproteobacteria bacterium RIFCSPLOWO2_02_FULL_55_12]OIJ74579.1 MAG: hypothetical protein A2V21_310100 [Deltaproteobacteria bacterium GWC2_55_46]HBG46479.1 hypothetical protein [Deltaproteobacteria bacterium]HCY10691.1 hypothetical protein [Deltaproteobacteria bacterium]
MISVDKGRILIYRLFDVAFEIDLAKIEERAKEGTRRLKLSKQPYMKALEFANPPVALELQPLRKSYFGVEAAVTVIAKAFDFGVLSIMFDIPVPPGTPVGALERAVSGLDGDDTIDFHAREYVNSLMETLGPAIVGPEIKEGFLEDYMIIYVEELAGGVKPAELLEQYDPSRLLLYESRSLSRFTTEETLKNSFSYYPDDLVIVHVDNAFIIDPSGSFDLPDILEFANAQIFELRYYDRVIDKEMNWIYKQISGRRVVSFLRLREYEKLARRLVRTVTDITEVTERVNNSLKVTEDIYYARIYRTFMTVLRSRDWETSIKEKLQTVMNTYNMVHDEISIRRAYIIELGILILIALEMVLAFYVR